MPRVALQNAVTKCAGGTIVFVLMEVEIRKSLISKTRLIQDHVVRVAMLAAALNSNEITMHKEFLI
jgi:hypothetical protein